MIECQSGQELAVRHRLAQAVAGAEREQLLLQAWLMGVEQEQQTAITDRQLAQLLLQRQQIRG